VSRSIATFTLAHERFPAAARPLCERGAALLLVHRFDAPSGSILLLHNLADQAVTVDLGPLDGVAEAPYDLLVDGPYDAPSSELVGLELHGWGYRWIRLARSNHG